MSISSGNGNGSSGYTMPALSNPSMPDRRRRGGKSMSGSYYNNGPRGDNRMNPSSYRDSRMNPRTTSGGGNGDGIHNGTYRTSASSGAGSEYDGQQQSLPSSLAVPERSGGGGGGGHIHHQHQQSGSYHQYSQQQHHHHHHHSHKSDYDGMSRSSRGGTTTNGGGSGHHHHSHSSVEHRSNGIHHQHHHQEAHIHVQHQHQPLPQGGFVGVGAAVGSGSHHAMAQTNDIVILQPPPPPQHQQQDHHFKGGNVNVASMPPPFQGGGVPQPIPMPIFGYPNGQPAVATMGTLVLCHIPYGMNPANVIAAGVQTQVIGTGFLNPTVSFACLPSQFIPSQPLIFQQPQQHFAPHPQPHFQQMMSGPPPQIPSANGADDTGSVLFDSTAILNPDANAFFPTMSSFSEDVEDDEGISLPVIPGEDVVVSGELELMDQKEDHLMKEAELKDQSLEKSGGGDDVNISGNGSELGSGNDGSLDPIMD